MKLNRTAIAAAIIAACAGLALQAQAAPAAPAASQVNARIVKQSVALKVNADGSYSETVDRVVEPLTVAGVSSVGHMEITYPANFATVKVLDAYTETANGKRVPVPASQIFNQSTQAAVEAPFLSDGHVMSLLYSAVTPGAKVHLEYVETFKRAYLPGIYAVSATLAPEIPAQAVDISLTTPKGMPAHFRARGDWRDSGTPGNDGSTRTASAAWTTVVFPPMASAAVTQYAPMAVLSTATDWDAIARAYDQLAGPSMALTPAVEATAKTAAAGATGEAAVANTYHWLQQHVQSVHVDYAHAGFTPPSAASTLKRGMGDSNANVALLCALLRADGITAVPAMISPSDRFVPYPGVDPFAFSHFLAYVPEYHLFLDTSARYAGIGALPAADQGRPVLVTGAHPELTRTPGPAPDAIGTREVQNLTLDAAGNLQGESVVTSTGWSATRVRADVLGDRSGERLQRFVQNDFYLGGRAGGMRVAAVKNRDDLDQPLAMTFAWHESDAAIPGPLMALLIPTSGRIAATLTPFTSAATRSVPSVLQPVTIEQATALRLPTGMTPEELPGNRNMTTPFGSYAVNYRYDDGVLRVDKRLQLTQFVVSPAEYPELHKLALMAVSGARKAIVLHHAG